jgi:hypothetical protein
MAMEEEACMWEKQDEVAKKGERKVQPRFKQHETGERKISRMPGKEEFDPGGRLNGTFARRLVQEFPTWQFLLVDLRCHKDSASRRGSHSVTSTAFDVLKLVGQPKITPRVLVGHSFGGKLY